MQSFKAFAVVALLLTGVSAVAESTALLRQPAVSADHLAFVYAGDLWVSERDGSNPRRLTTSPAEENNPHFSPDGSMIAFAAGYDGNTDVYVIAVTGGNPERLTWHPGDDTPVGWSADGGAVAFASRRETDHGRSAQLYHVPVAGGAPVKQMEARFFRGQWSESGERLAYIDHGPAYNGLYGGTAGWKGYRGGASPSVKILDPEQSELLAIPGDRVNDINPFWLGNQVYFVSDREDKTFNLHRFDPASLELTRISDESTWDIRWASGHGDRIVYEAGGRLHELAIETGQTRTLAIELRPDLPQLRAGWRDVAGTIQEARLSPNGKRALITARGEVFSVPVEHGSTRNLTVTDGVREYTGLWSPAGDQVAWIVESRDGQTLVVADQNGADARTFELGPDFYQLQAWDADNGRIIYTDNRLGLNVIDLANGRTRTIDRNRREAGFDLSFSPDGRYLAYTRIEANWFRDLFIHDFDSGESFVVSDGMADVAAPAFSPDGAYLYFAASTNTGPMQFGLDMSSQERPYRAGLYALVLAADGDSPLKPRTGDESGEEDGDEDNGDNGERNGEKDNGDKDNGDDDKVVTRIDRDGLFARKVALPGAKGNYGNLRVAADGSLFYVERTQPGASVEPPGSNSGQRQSPASLRPGKTQIQSRFARTAWL